MTDPVTATRWTAYDRATDRMHPEELRRALKTEARLRAAAYALLTPPQMEALITAALIEGHGGETANRVAGREAIPPTAHDAAAAVWCFAQTSPDLHGHDDIRRRLYDLARLLGFVLDA